MKKVYKCEYCDEISDNAENIIKHEKNCGNNPENKINDETVVKLARFFGHCEDCIEYVLLEDFADKLDYIESEFDRATKNNCPCAVYDQKTKMRNLIIDIRGLRENKSEKWFKGLVERDNPELIEAIRAYFKNPEYRIGKGEKNVKNKR